MIQHCRRAGPKPRRLSRPFASRAEGQTPGIQVKLTGHVFITEVQNNEHVEYHRVKERKQGSKEIIKDYRNFMEISVDIVYIWVFICTQEHSKQR